LLVPETATAAADAHGLAGWAGTLGGEVGRLEYVRVVGMGQLLANGGASEGARAAALVSAFAEARSMVRSMIILDDIDLLLAPTAMGVGEGSGTAGGAAPLSGVLLGTLRDLMREAAAEASGPASDAGPPCLHVLATVAHPSPALLAALRPTLRTAVHVPLLHTADAAAQALTTSPALATVLLPDAVDATATAALSHGPLPVHELYELVYDACLDADADAAAQVAAVESRCVDYR